MTLGFVLMWMLFMHIVDDYYLQGILAKMKQKSWWKENAPQDMYKNDYLVALIMHAISWAFCIMLPLAIYLQFQINLVFGICFAINILIHSLVDNMKANRKTINLVQDQTCHLLQIWFTFIVVLYPFNWIIVS